MQTSFRQGVIDRANVLVQAISDAETELAEIKELAPWAFDTSGNPRLLSAGRRAVPRGAS